MEPQAYQGHSTDVTQSNFPISQSQISSSVINTQPPPTTGHSKYVVPPDAVNMELRRKLWEGLLPVKVDLAMSDLTSLETPRSLYIMAPRENYFFYILSEVKSLFDQYAPSDKVDAYDEMWFEFNNVPLKWNVPIGVQFDTFVGVKEKQKDLPWCLIFHYRGFPEEQVQRLEGMNFFRFHFINALKESHHLRLGSASEILSHMSKKDETRMIDGLLKHNFESFWEINQPLCDKHIAELKKYAIRVFSNKHHTYLQPSIETNGQHISEDGQWEDQAQQVTLGEALADAFPRLLEKALNDQGDIEVVKKRNFEIVAQGVEVDLKTPLYWMQLNMSNLDNFLYLSFHMK